MRYLMIVCLAVATTACKKPQPVEPSPEPEQGVDAAPDARPAEPPREPDAADAAGTGDATEASSACPQAREPEGMCAQVIVWARVPGEGTCCQYPTPCHVPDESWQTFTSPAQCEGAGGSPDAGTIEPTR